jgi:mRNA interferase MazF
MIERGGVYLANLNPNKGSEPGKVRPVVIIQANALNTIKHPTVIVLPLTTQLVSEAYPLRFSLPARGKLKKDSDILCDQISAITTTRITSDKLLQLSNEELTTIEQQIKVVLDFDDSA